MFTADPPSINTHALKLPSLLKKLNERRMPSGKRDANWLMRAGEVRQKLRDFWNQVRRCHRADHPRDMVGMDAELEAISYDLAPGHLQALEDERRAILTPVYAKMPTTPPSRGLTKVWQHQEEPKVRNLSLRQKQKQKTRPTGDSTTNPAELTASDESLLPTETPVDIPKLNIKPKSLKIFKKMLPSTSFLDNSDVSDVELETEQAKGQVDWQEFVRAMAEAGFGNTPCGGSIVSFSNGSQSIIFHRPHPIAKLGKVKLLSMGKRLHKHFGWVRESFVTESKTS